ncbi:hypothetical protein LCGC14_0582130 [marine sediment metagenome]|uniref:Uncharacterized protein n=1 Tax=marine sediment metagenome TaxID=412755 RepID=A0A0F9UPA0_9ZZZZ
MVTMTEEYMPTPAEMMVARHLDGLMGDLLSGNLDGIGVCAIRKNGEPAFFYLNQPEEPVLRPALNRLLGLYESNMQFKKLITAPRENRSYLTH